LGLTRQEKLDAQAAFAAGSACTDCGGIHQRTCPRVRRKVFHPNGNLIEVEYWRHGQWDESAVIFPEDAYDPEDSTGSRE
jgi:hypothetical protein